MKNKKNKAIVFSRSFEKSFALLPREIHYAFWKKLELFIENPSHLPLRVKKIKGTDSIWEMSVTMNYRVTFMAEPNEILFRKIGPHDVLRNP